MAKKLIKKNVVTSDSIQYHKLNSNEYAFIDLEVSKVNKWTFYVEYVKLIDSENETIDTIRVSLEEFPTFLALMQAGGWQKCDY
jgi:hypothetical protein